MMTITIYRRNGSAMHTVAAEYRRDAILKLIATKADLRGSDLSGSNLRGSNLSGSNLRGSNLSGCDLSWCDLSGCDLIWCDLSGSNLSGCDLSWCDLSGSNLSGCDLSGSNLRGTKGLSPYQITPLLMLLDQPGKIRAYKMTDEYGRSPIHPRGRITYSVGSTHEVSDALTDVHVQCGAGINVATLDWIMREWKPGYRIFVVEFEAADIAAIPTSTDGKFRLHRCTVVAEKDLAELGLVEKVMVQA